MKRQYVKPEMQTEEVELAGIIANSVEDDLGNGFGGDKTDGESDSKERDAWTDGLW